MKVIGVKVIGPFSLRLLDLGAAKIRFNNGDDGRRDLVLQIQHVFERAIVPVGPQMGARLGLGSIAP
jgi:hypothetical protein